MSRRLQFRMFAPHLMFLPLITSRSSWIGSMNAFLILSGGLFFGRVYDTGHL